MSSRFRSVLSLGKIRIVLLSTASAAAGFILAAGLEPAGLAATIAGVLLLACGAATLNQVQDRFIDAQMERTRKRPLPAGEVTPAAAVVIGVIGVVAGAGIMLATGGVASALLSLTAVLWYNGFYSWLKRVTPFAAVPGGVVGALPPLIGWTAGGGSPFDGAILALALFMFLWQVPHFWLLLMRHTDDYRRSGLPILTNLFSPRQLSRITFVWIASTVVACILLPLFVAVGSPAAIAAMGVAGVALVGRAAGMLIPGGEAAASTAVFRMINVYVFLVLSILSLQALV
jgi:protoheme IX farnesyltransferase